MGHENVSMGVSPPLKSPFLGICMCDNVLRRSSVPGHEPWLHCRSTQDASGPLLRDATEPSQCGAVPRSHKRMCDHVDAQHHVRRSGRSGKGGGTRSSRNAPRPQRSSPFHSLCIHPSLPLSCLVYALWKHPSLPPLLSLMYARTPPLCALSLLMLALRLPTGRRWSRCSATGDLCRHWRWMCRALTWSPQV